MHAYLDNEVRVVLFFLSFQSKMTTLIVTNLDKAMPMSSSLSIRAEEMIFYISW